MANELRDAINRFSDVVRERTTVEYIAFNISYRRGSTFSIIHPQKLGFCFEVQIPRNEFNLEGLNVTYQQSTPYKYSIHVDEETNLSLLIDAARQAYERTKRNVGKL